MSRKLHNVLLASERLPGSEPKTHHFAHFEGHDYWVRNGYRLEDCGGEAHSNAYIDNCSRCAPLWGVIAVKDD